LPGHEVDHLMAQRDRSPTCPHVVQRLAAPGWVRGERCAEQRGARRRRPRARV